MSTVLLLDNQMRLNTMRYLFCYIFDNLSSHNVNLSMIIGVGFCVAIVSDSNVNYR